MPQSAGNMHGVHTCTHNGVHSSSSWTRFSDIPMQLRNDLADLQFNLFFIKLQVFRHCCNLVCMRFYIIHWGKQSSFEKPPLLMSLHASWVLSVSIVDKHLQDFWTQSFLRPLSFRYNHFTLHALDPQWPIPKWHPTPFRSSSVSELHAMRRCDTINAIFSMLKRVFVLTKNLRQRPAKFLF